MAFFVGNGHINSILSAVNRRHHKKVYLFLELFSDSPDTSEYLDFHIPHRQAGTTNQVQPTSLYKDDIANLRSKILKRLLNIITQSK